MSKTNEKHSLLQTIALSFDPHNQKAVKAAKALQASYDFCTEDKADCIIALGGDGFMLEIMHRVIERDVPIYGMNFGAVGFLMNDFSSDNLIERVKQAEKNYIRPLQMIATDDKGKTHTALAFNEVSLFRASYQAAKLAIVVDEKQRMEALTADGVLLATPAGSTAYNLSVYGPILPVSANLLALTPISPFRPRHWRGAILPNSAKVTINCLDTAKRPVNAVADATEFTNIVKLTIKELPSKRRAILFDQGHALDERILREQFRP